jgi:uncharacterized protein (DUF362 family)
MSVATSKPHVALFRFDGDPHAAVRSALLESGILARIGPDTRVAIKPNLTYPYHRPGVTTTPVLLREAATIIRERTRHVAVVETDGGYGAWQVAQAFEEHGIYRLGRELGLEVLNLCDLPRHDVEFTTPWGRHRLPLPTRLVKETDLFLSMPVPKIHCMTGVSLGYKNQWGCVPDLMRLRRHYIFNDAIVAINRTLQTAVLGDGTWFLDNSGPMEGTPVRMNLVIASQHVGAFDLYTSELMGYPWKRVPHLKRAVALGHMPRSLADITFNVSPHGARSQVFRLHRTLRHWIALSGFKSRTITWLGYESWFGRVVLHAILYAICGPNIKPKPDAGPAGAKA